MPPIRAAGSQDPELLRLVDGLGPGAGPELAVDRLHVRLDRVAGDVQLRGRRTPSTRPAPVPARGDSPRAPAPGSGRPRPVPPSGAGGYRRSAARGDGEAPGASRARRRERPATRPISGNARIASGRRRPSPASPRQSPMRQRRHPSTAPAAWSSRSQPGRRPGSGPGLVPTVAGPADEAGGPLRPAAPAGGAWSERAWHRRHAGTARAEAEVVRYPHRPILAPPGLARNGARVYNFRVRNHQGHSGGPRPGGESSLGATRYLGRPPAQA